MIPPLLEEEYGEIQKKAEQKKKKKFKKIINKIIDVKKDFQEASSKLKNMLKDDISQLLRKEGTLLIIPEFEGTKYNINELFISRHKFVSILHMYKGFNLAFKIDHDYIKELTKKDLLEDLKRLNKENIEWIEKFYGLLNKLLDKNIKFRIV